MRALGVAIFLVFPAISLAAPKERVAVPGITGGAGWDRATLVTVEELLLSALDATGDLAAVGQSDLARELGYDAVRQGLGCADDAACATKTAGMYDARFLVAADLGKIGKTNFLTLKLLDVPAAAVVKRVTKPFANEDALFDAAREVAVEIAGAVREQTGGAQAPENKAVSAPPAPVADWKARFADVPKPGFSCAAKLNANEALICAEPRLAEADGALNALFKGLVAKLPAESVKALRAAQRGWIRNRDRTCVLAKDADAPAKAAAAECMDRLVGRRIGDFLAMEKSP